jgi:hypothetical protein
MAHERIPYISLAVAFLLIAMLVTLHIPEALAQASKPPVFLPVVTYPSGGQGTMAIAVGDVNGDGKPDLLVASACPLTGCSNTEVIGVLLGNGDGTFQPVMTSVSGGVTAYVLGSIVLGDLNGDGKPDVVVTNACGSDSVPACWTGSGSVSVLLGNGDGTFLPAVNYASGGYFDVSVSIADVNNDGKPDLLVANHCADYICANDGIVSVLLGNGDGTFQPAVNYDSGAHIAAFVTVADVNGDGKPDLLVANECIRPCATGSASVLLGNGNGTFQPAVNYESGGRFPESLAIADVNGDGEPDLLVPNCTTDNGCSDGGPGAVGVLLGNGDGTFTPAVTYSSGGNYAASVAVADMNGDNKPDLLVNNLNGTVGILLGNRDGTFQPALGYPAEDFSFAVADVNGDGKPDLLVSTDYTVGVLLNNTPFCTTAPTITLSATPPSLWPPNGKIVPVTVSGKITNTSTGCTTKTAAYAVRDEYGDVQPRGPVILGAGGAYSFTVWLQASRLGTDLDGRLYTVTVGASNNAGKTGSKAGTVIVPHDQGH